nr:hypothetical protein GCM10020093_052270 [Planobispora longispora]
MHARAAYLVDTTTGTVHLSKRATERVPIASLTKVMTAYVVLREARLGDVVTVRKPDVRHARRNDATHASLRPGERLTVRDLLYGVMLPPARTPPTRWPASTAPARPGSWPR